MVNVVFMEPDAAKAQRRLDAHDAQASWLRAASDEALLAHLSSCPDELASGPTQLRWHFDSEMAQHVAFTSSLL